MYVFNETITIFNAHRFEQICGLLISFSISNMTIFLLLYFNVGNCTALWYTVVFKVLYK